MDHLTADFMFGGCWGDHISFGIGETGINKDIIELYGQKVAPPKPGQTLLIEYEVGWMLFEFVSIEHLKDFDGMFFAKAKLLQRYLKDGA